MSLTIANSLGPVFLIMAVGWVLRQAGFMATESFQAINRLVYWVGFPSLLFYKIAGAKLALGEAGTLLIVMLGATCATIMAGYLFARWLSVPWASQGTFVQAGFRGNLAFVGLPIVIYASSSSGENAVAIEATALLAFGPLLVLYNMASVLTLLVSRQQLDARILRAMGRGLVSNPLLIACLAGMLCAAVGGPLPVMAQRSLAAIGQMSLPLALIGLGGSLVKTRLRGRVIWLVATVSLKLILMPLIGFGIAWFLGLSLESTRIALILLSCPTAAASYVLVRQIGGDESLASAVILTSTLFAAPVLAVVLVVT